MDAFRLRDRLVDENCGIRRFVTIWHKRVNSIVDTALNAGFLWPDPLLQLHPRASAPRIEGIVPTAWSGTKPLPHRPDRGHVLRSGSGNGIQAFVIYPLNARQQPRARAHIPLALVPEGRSPITFARYTGRRRTHD